MKFLKDHRGFIVFLLCFGLFRTAIADWNPIPTGSMRPTLLEGDVVLVNRLAYDLKVPLSDVLLITLGQPQRGDVVTFSSPLDGTRLIKRIVALPGDVVEMHDERLRINGEFARYAEVVTRAELIQPGLSARVEHTDEHGAGQAHAHAVQWIPDAAARRDFGPVTVPAGHYFVLGDNRDNSHDSRYIGSVPRELLIGRAHHIVFSADMLGSWMPRWQRVAAAIR